MTPQLTLLPGIADRTHLTGEQFGELLAGSTATNSPASSAAEAHLLACEKCAAELATLRESLCLFRQASNAYADSGLQRLPQMTLPARPAVSTTLEPAYWAAAAALFLAALLPMQMMRQHPLRPVPVASVNAPGQPVESDEALLEDVNREVSASVPTPMQALADPTADGSAGIETSIQNSIQRKD